MKKKAVFILCAVLFALLLAVSACLMKETAPSSGEDAPLSDSQPEPELQPEPEPDAAIEIPDYYPDVPVKETLYGGYHVWKDYAFTFECEEYASVGAPVQSMEDAFLAAAKLTGFVNEATFEIPYRADDPYRLIRIGHGTENNLWKFEFASEQCAEKNIEAGSLWAAVDGTSGEVLLWRVNFSETASVTRRIGDFQVSFNPDILKDYAVINDWETAMDVGDQLMKKLKLEGKILATIVRATEENAWRYDFYKPELLNTDMEGGGLSIILDGEDCTILASYAEE